MQLRRIWLLVAGLTALGATRADATEDEPTAPSVCVPPCPDGQTCVASTCVPGPRPPAPTAPPPAAIPLPDEAPPPDPAPPPDAAYEPSLPRRPQRQKRTFVALPHAGVHSYQNSWRAGYRPGLRFGSLIGGRFNDQISFNGELTYDFANVDAALGDVQESSYSFALGPLWQLPTGPLEIVFGPKAGFSYTGRTGTSGVAEKLSTGWILGLNAGLFMPVSAGTSIGVLLAYEFRGTVRYCSSQSGTESCYSGSGGEGVTRLLGLTAAALF